MEITLSIAEFCMILLTIGLLFLIFYSVRLIKKVIITVEKTNKTMDDANEITSVVKNKVNEVDQALNKLKEIDRIFKIVKSKVTDKEKKKNKEE